MKELICSESGQGLSEYALILSLIVIAIILTLTEFGENLFSLYQEKILGEWP
ncbi:MAG: Flp family type IVb pilin [Clostridiaceae bacterium]